MKKLYLLFGFALMGVLFVACQKDEPVVEEIAVDDTEMLSVERTNHCGIDEITCKDTCVSYNMCCCTIEWLYYDRINEEYFSHPSQYQFMDMPIFCAAEDIADSLSTCPILHTVYDDSLMQCTTLTIWNSTRDEFCPPFYPVLPITTRLTYKCVPQNTAMRITNPWHSSSLIEIHMTLTCNTGTGSPSSDDYVILADETVVIEFNGCAHRLDCISDS